MSRLTLFLTITLLSFACQVSTSMALPPVMSMHRRPTYRAALEGNEIDLRGLLDVLVDNPSFTSHPPPRNLPLYPRRVSHITAAALLSPYRRYKFHPTAARDACILPFSKENILVDILGVVDGYGEPNLKSRSAAIQHLEIDLYQALPSENEDQQSIFLPHDLGPLILFRHLTYLKLEGMTQSYQLQIWQCVWLNPRLSTLSLSISTTTDAQPLCAKTIRVARVLADSYPSMRQVCHGHHRAYVPEKLPLVKLELTRFIVGSEAFEWLDGRKLREIRLTQCHDGGFDLVGEEWETTTVVIDSKDSRPEQRAPTYSINLRKQRPSFIDRGGG